MMFHAQLLLVLSILLSANSSFVPITSVNHDEVMQNSRLTFVSFTASWCPFSQMLLTSFTDAAITYKDKYPERRTIWGNVDCMNENELSNKYSINKYPTMKVFFYGHLVTEYRGSRQVQALIDYVEQMENTTSLVKLNEVESLTQWQRYAVPQKGTLILWFPRGSPPFELILKAIVLIHDRLTVVVPEVSNLLEHEEHKLWFSLDGEHVQNFNGSVTNFKEIMEWVQQRSEGMVRELTFENMEEMVEDGKPMLILLRKKDDKETEKKFVEAIRRELEGDLLSKVNPLMADGGILTAVLRHFRKDVNDLPFLLIDQLVHSYPSPWSGDEIFAKGNIKQFVVDLFNETHHRKLHKKVDELLKKILAETERIEKQAELEDQKTEAPKTLTKQESLFKQLKPGKNRYSFAKEEL
ncbi:hypothetical protein CRE_10167 [Caenorhabditis remanei]|uniref:Thioredoxin domain-containing protein n=1 Tax=Caenorhabditis remanei TaxID=31234 RepID=E3M6M9_CAERE|nr:hypothetical protein CRE_10167 [Caenorhabditis remanei]